LFHFYVHERLRAEGPTSAELAASTDVARLRMLPLVEPTILYFHQRGFARAVEDDALLHLQEDIPYCRYIGLGLLSARYLAHHSLLGLGLGVSLTSRAAVVQIHLKSNTAHRQR